MKGTCTFGLPPEAIARLESIRVDLSPGVQAPAVTEGAARQQEALSHSEVDQQLRELLKARYSARWVYLEAVYDDYVIYSAEATVMDGDRETSKTLPGGDQFFAAAYTVSDADEVMVGDAFVVTRVVSYVREQPAEPAEESAGAEELLGDFVSIAERAVADDGTFPVKLIQPGWGSSGYYGKGLIERDVPRRYPAGTHMYWNHQTADEAARRPEGDLRDLAAVFVTAPVYEENGVYGPGAYAKAKAFGDYKERIEELAPHIGVSIRARGRGVKGEAEGRKGRIITSLDEGLSVDFVTKPGAGGRIVEMFESARSGAPTPPPKEEAHSMDKLQEAQNRATVAETSLTEAQSEVTRLTEANATLTTENTGLRDEVAKLREGVLLSQARSLVEAAVGAAKLPDVVKARLTEALAGSPPVAEDGTLDEAALTERITAQVDAAAAEVAAIAGSPVTGMGGGSATGGKAALKESAKRRYLAEGLPEDVAERRAEIFANGR